ncbi:M23 family metallopeptidase [Patescibacteria group bacterium]|nr:M23 family metallopeptidase [Patescibacteria group bacterium]
MEVAAYSSGILPNAPIEFQTELIRGAIIMLNQILNFRVIFTLFLLSGTGCDNTKNNSPSRCEGNFLVFPDGSTMDCALQESFCEIGAGGEAQCTSVEGGGPINPNGTPRFLVLPLDYDARVVNGWYYNFAGNGAGLKHNAIDFEAPVGTPVYAACSGVAMTSSQYSRDPPNRGYGKFIQVRCDTTNPSGANYHLLYGHVSSAMPTIKSYSEALRGNQIYTDWTPVVQGDLIGHSGKEDTTWAHLHFEVQQGSYCGPAVDPYDIFATTTSASNSAEQEYPPVGSRYDGCGPNYLWTTCPPETAQVSTCPVGYEYICGSEVGMVDDTLYRYCPGGSYVFYEACAHGCEVLAGDQDDYCAEEPTCPDGNGLYCGESVGLTAGTLYNCYTGIFSTNQVCAYGCEVMPAGENDRCASESCTATDYWNPATDTETDSTGQQAAATANVSIRAEVRQSGAGLEVRACKVGSTFEQNVYFSVYDAATTTTCGVTVSSWSAVGQECTEWVGLNNDTGYSEGQVFGGIWQLVSPATSAGDWSNSTNCSVSGNPTGTCWNGIGLTLTRTCL